MSGGFRLEKISLRKSISKSYKIAKYKILNIFKWPFVNRLTATVYGEMKTRCV